MELQATYHEGHLIVAAIRILKHRHGGRPPTVEEVAEELGCDSLAYLSIDGLYEAIGLGRDTHCDACFTGEYPLEHTDSANGKFALEQDSKPLPMVSRALL